MPDPVSKLTTILLACLHLDPGRLSAAELAALTEAEWEELVALSDRLGMQTVFFYSLASLKLENRIPSGQLSALKRSYYQNAARNLVLRNELLQILEAFQTHHIPAVVLKGAYLAEFVYENSAIRQMSDIDLLIHLEDLESAAKIVENLGFVAAYPYDVKTIAEVAHHLPAFTKGEIATVELHWTVMEISDNDPVDVTGLWKRALPVEFDPTQALGLSPEDLLLHICGHAAYSHVFDMGLYSLFDMMLIIKHYQSRFEWSQFLERVGAWHWERGVFLTLRLAQDLLGAPVPEAVLTSLCPPDFNEELLAVVKAQVLSTGSVEGVITPSLARWHMAGWQGKLKILWQRVFLPKRVLAAQQKVNADSPWLFFYYPVRLYDMLIRLGARVIRLSGRKSYEATFTERKAQLQSWLKRR